MIRQCVLGILFSLVAVYSTPTSKQILVEDSDYPLPTDITPVSYDITLNFPDTAFTKDAKEFSGTAKMTFKVGSADSIIKFHLDQNFITLTSLSFGETALDKTKDYSIDGTTDIVTIAASAATVAPDKEYTVTAVYTGKLSTDGYGIYQGSYLNAKKETVYYLATQVSPIYARRVFPCFDEPRLKAPFTVTVIYPSNTYTVLFNTEQSAPPSGDTTQTVTFTTTKAMSTYQFALFVSDFAKTSDADPNPTYQVWYRTTLTTPAAYALAEGPAIVKQLDDYTKIPYSTNRKILNQVALPDLNKAATDSWGLTSSSENLLLLDTTNSPTSSQQTVTQYIANQIAHQWFGDLTTCSTWADLFLNEGLSAYFEYFIADKVHDKWELTKQFIVRALHPLLEYDSLGTAPALTKNAVTPQEINDKFDIIASKKGASIIRMVANLVGDDVFKQGIQEYLKTPSVTNDNLWTSIQGKIPTDSSLLPKNVELKTIMANWLSQTGYPLVSVSLDGKNLTFSQKKFLLTADAKNTETWYVPITYKLSTASSVVVQTWLPPSGDNVVVTLDKDIDWVVVNNLQTGYYRVNYDESLWKKIVDALNTKDFAGISEENRAQIVDDAFNIAKSGQLAFSKFLAYVQFLKADTSYYPWAAAFEAYSYILQRVPESEGLRANIIKELTSLMGKFNETFDVKDGVIDALTQDLVLKHACLIGDDTCIKGATDALTTYKIKDTKPNKNLRDVIYCYGLRNRKDTEATDYYKFLLGKYTEETDTTEKSTILSALGCASDDTSLTALRDEIMKADGVITSQDSLAAFESLYSRSSKGATLVLDYLSANATAIIAKFTDINDRKSLITGIANKLTTADQVKTFKSLADKFTDIKDTIDTAGKVADANVGWYATNQKDLDAYYNPGDGGGGAGNSIHVNIVLMTIVAIFSLLGVMTQ